MQISLLACISSRSSPLNEGALLRLIAMTNMSIIRFITVIFARGHEVKIVLNE